MHHPITKTTKRVILSEELDYLSPNVVYLCTPSRSGQYIRFDREDGSSGTTLRDYMWALGQRKGIIKELPL